MPEASEFFKMIFELILHYYFFDLNLFYFKFIFLLIFIFFSNPSQGLCLQGGPIAGGKLLGANRGCGLYGRWRWQS
jgi:hypothetical protein